MKHLFPFHFFLLPQQKEGHAILTASGTTQPHLKHAVFWNLYIITSSNAFQHNAIQLALCIHGFYTCGYNQLQIRHIFLIPRSETCTGHVLTVGTAFAVYFQLYSIYIALGIMSHLE